MNEADTAAPAAGRAPGIGQALTPVAVLVFLLAFSVYLFGEDASYGPNQIALCVGALVAALIGWRNGLPWDSIEASMIRGVGVAVKPVLILFSVGVLIGSWIMSGTVPTMIYYSLLLLDPAVFYAAACVICALIALSIGSSWTVAGTVGIALIGAAAGMGLSVAITAGAIISGAYFGDKMSPLSETTNLAPAVAGTDLFTHIGHMVWTTLPAIIIALIIYGFMGLNIDQAASADDLAITLRLLTENFTLNPLMLLPVVLLLVMANRRFPPIPTILSGAAAGIVLALLFQPDIIRAMSEAAADAAMPEAEGVAALAEADPGWFFNILLWIWEALPDWLSGLLQWIGAGLAAGFAVFVVFLRGVWITLFNGFVLNSGNETLDDLMTGGGMSSMLTTVWLILCAMIFGAVMEHTRLLQCLVDYALSFVHSTGSLIITTLATCIGANIITSDQYISVVLPGRMYKMEYINRRLDVKNLSRALEDSGTVTSPLVPWNTCGAYMSGTLGVATFAYLPYAFFNLICPVVSAIYGLTNFKITPATEPTPATA